MQDTVVAAGSPALWVFGVMMSGFAAAIFIQAISWMASGKAFTDTFAKGL